MGKAITAAVCGALVGAAAIILLGTAGVHSLWPALLIGVACGLLMKAMAKSANGSYANGALAALGVLVAVVAGKFALLGVLSDPSGANAIKPSQVAQVSPDVDSATKIEEEPAPTEEAPAEAEEQAAPSADEPVAIDKATASSLESTVELKAVTPMEVNVYDALFMIVGAVIAYQIGKGESSAPTVAEDEPAAA